MPSIDAHGYDWTLVLYPHGRFYPGYLSAVLSLSKPGPAVEATGTVKLGSVTRSLNSKICASTGYAFNLDQLIERSRLFDRANNFLSPSGSLVIDVALQVYVKKTSFVWYPPTADSGSTTGISSSTKLLADLLQSSRYSDVTFHVGHEKFKLHRFVLDGRASALFQMIERPDQTITLDDVDADSFQSMVRYIYTEEGPQEQNDNDSSLDLEAAKTLLSTSNRFGCKGLKLWMESVIVDKHLDADNAADLLLLADAHHCALLKETAMKICQNNADAVMRTEGWARLKESSALLAELFVAMATTTNKSAAAADDDPERLGVAELRNRLLKKRGRIVDDVDGSREMLVKRLRSE